MSIAQALGYPEGLIFKQIPEDRIKYFGERDSEPIKIFSEETQIFTDNDGNRKATGSVYNI